MANFKFDLLRSNGDSYDTLYPKTIVSQVEGLESALSSKVETSLLGANGGVATLDGSGALTPSQIPSWIMTGGWYWADTIDTDNTLEVMGSYTYELSSFVSILTDGLAPGQTVNDRRGWFVENGITDDGVSVHFYDGTPTNANYVIIGNGDEGDKTSPIKLETGDAIVFTKLVTEGSLNTYYFMILNTNTDMATNVSYGTVKLNISSQLGLAANADLYNSSTNNTGIRSDETVITGAQLHGMLYSGDLNGYDGAKKITTTDHQHSQYQPSNSVLTKLTQLSSANGNFIVGSASGWSVESGATARESLGLKIDTDVQAYDDGLQSLAALGSAADKMIYSTGKDTWAELTTTSKGRSLLGIADAAAGRTALELVVGTDVQAYNAKLQSIAGLAVTDGNIIVGDGNTWVAESGATARASLGVYSTTEVTTKLANRPEIYYDTTPTASAVEGAFIIANVASA